MPGWAVVALTTVLGTGRCKETHMYYVRIRRAIGPFLAGLLITCVQLAAAQDCVTPVDGMVITEDALLCPGTYYLPNGISIGASGITLDGGGAVLVGGEVGYGLTCNGHDSVSVRNLTTRGYFHGMHFYDADDASVVECSAWDTPELPEGEIFLNIFDGPNGSYGHAMWFRYCDRAMIMANDVSEQQNGISLFDCMDAYVAGNYASYNSGWGITLWNTHYSTIRNNTADYCTRNYYGWSGADAASLLMVYDSSHNVILRNSLVGGGDGVFLAGATHSLERHPCNFNYFAWNDCSESPNNGFEGTFSQGNVYECNGSDGCNYGYWLGYSWEAVVRGNQASHCHTAGIAIEHGRHNTIESNRLTQNSRAIWLWTDNDEALLNAFPEAEDSYGYMISANVITHNGCGLYSNAENAANPDLECYDYTVVGNTFTDNTHGIVVIRTHSSTIRTNVLIDCAGWGIRLEQSPGNLLYNNWLDNAHNGWDNSTNDWNLPGRELLVRLRRRGHRRRWDRRYGLPAAGREQPGQLPIGAELVRRRPQR
jgi:parallel beta-helix repeat protein